MKQQSAISSRLSSTNANASRRASIRVLLSLLAISTVLILSTAADNNSNTRYNNLGNRLMCPCESEPATGFGGKGGCHQVSCSNALTTTAPSPVLCAAN